MPVVGFTIEWPDGVRQQCQSPSTVLHEHLAPGETYEVGELVEVTRIALTAAGERVRAKFGFFCTASTAQQEAIERAAARYPQGGTVTVTDVEGMRRAAA